MNNPDTIPRPTALFEAIADSLKERILAYVLPPGAAIDECALARELGVSRTPVREAIKVLARDGLVRVAHRRPGHCTVTAWSQDDLAELLRFIEHLDSFPHADHDNPFAEELIQKLTDRLYLAVGPAFATADQDARRRLEHPASAASLTAYFAWRRLEVARRTMADTSAA